MLWIDSVFGGLYETRKSQYGWLVVRECHFNKADGPWRVLDTQLKQRLVAIP